MRKEGKIEEQNVGNECCVEGFVQNMHWHIKRVRKTGECTQLNTAAHVNNTNGTQKVAHPII